MPTSKSTLIDSTRVENRQTNNGMTTNQTSTNNCIDMFFLVGASRNMREEEMIRLFVAARAENPDMAYRILFWSRDIRGGAGEKRFFNTIMRFVQKDNQFLFNELIQLVPEYGYWKDMVNYPSDDVYELVSTALANGNSLCAKWMPRKGIFANSLRKYMGITPKEYRKLLVELTDVVETKMCNKDWKNIKYNKIPSKAFNKYLKAWNRNDDFRFSLFLDDVNSGKSTINAAAIFPHTIVRSVEESGANEQWNNLPDYMKDSNERILPICDVSGSMMGTPMDVSVALGIYISERNKGIFKDAFITFSANPQMNYLKGTLRDRVRQLESADWGMNTDLYKSFKLILDSAVRDNISGDEMPTKILILSDMEFDESQRDDWNNDLRNEWNPTAMQMIEEMYTEAGYQMPGIIFWNLNGRIGNVPATSLTKNVGLVSGFSPAIMTSILEGGDSFTPGTIMNEAIYNKRYDAITAAIERFMYT